MLLPVLLLRLPIISTITAVVKGSTSNRLVIGIWDLPIAVCCLSLPVETILPLLLGWAV